MKTSLLNSKKCSIANLVLAGALLAQSASVMASPVPVRDALKGQILAYSSSSFEPLLTRWSQEYGTQAVHPLLALVSDQKNADRTRYIALMGAAKLGGPSVAGLIAPHLKDSSWMIRSASLRALSALKNPQTASAVLPLLKDRALVVRVEAVDAVRTLRPKGSTKALVAALKDPNNYRLGKAQWLPQRALKALAVMGDRSVAPQLRFLLDHRSDPALQHQTLATLEALTGQRVNGSLPLSVRVLEWKKKLVAMATKRN